MKTIGEIIRTLRKEKELTQKELSELLDCSREFIGQIERNERVLPDYFILPISTYLNCDFKRLIGSIGNYHNVQHALLCYELIDAIDLKDNEKLNELLKNEIVITEFDYGHTKILKQYCTALVEKYINNNIDESTSICLEILEIKQIKDIPFFRPKICQEYRYYSSILTLGLNLHLSENYLMHKALLSNTIHFLENYIFNGSLPNSYISYFYKKFYLISLNNYADVLFGLGEYENALTYCSKTISFASKQNISYMLEYWYCLKVEILYSLNQIENAKSTYVQFKSICEFQNNYKLLNSSTERFSLTYPQLFN